MTGISATPGFNVEQMFNKSMDNVTKKGEELSKQMETIMNGDEVSPEQMLAMQFRIGQYNAMMEALSTVTKSMTDTMKNLAQRSS